MESYVARVAPGLSSSLNCPDLARQLKKKNSLVLGTSFKLWPPFSDSAPWSRARNQRNVELFPHSSLFPKWTNSRRSRLSEVPAIIWFEDSASWSASQRPASGTLGWQQWCDSLTEATRFSALMLFSRSPNNIWKLIHSAIAVQHDSKR